MNSVLNKINSQTTFSNGYTASVVYFPETDEHDTYEKHNQRKRHELRFKQALLRIRQRQRSEC